MRIDNKTVRISVIGAAVTLGLAGAVVGGAALWQNRVDSAAEDGQVHEMEEVLTAEEVENPDIVDPEPGDTFHEHPGKMPEGLGVWEETDGSYTVVEQQEGPSEEEVAALRDQVQSGVGQDDPGKAAVALEQAWHSSMQAYGTGIVAVYPGLSGDGTWEVWSAKEGTGEVAVQIDIFMATTRDEAIKHAAQVVEESPGSVLIEAG